MSEKKKRNGRLVRVYCGNRQVIGQRCGWGEGRTKEEAIAKAMERAGGSERNAEYDEQSDMVWFDGGCFC